VAVYEGAAQAKLGRVDEALEVYERLRRKSDSIVVLLRLASFYFESRDFTKVRDLSEKIRARDGEGRYERVLSLWT